MSVVKGAGRGGDMTVLGPEPQICGTRARASVLWLCWNVWRPHTPSLSSVPLPSWGPAGPPPRRRRETLTWLLAWSRPLVSRALASLWEMLPTAWGERMTHGRAPARTGPHTRPAASPRSLESSGHTPLL